MTEELTSFLERNRIHVETWERSGCDWEVLSAILYDHISQTKTLSESAAFYANLIQKLPGVHSVRWRVKDGEHLLEKIIRKKASGEEKYTEINVTNYFEIITDLIGIRALHLFKDDCFQINDELSKLWAPVEKPIAYIRNGDPDQLITQYREHNLEVKVHPVGYRSVHYVFSARPLNRTVNVEVQTRTIFEEGWSEIDHKIRYPNFSDSELVGYFLTIFNRMSGSADEMGSFVRGLASSIEEFQAQIKQANAERDESISSMEHLIAQLGRLEKQDKHSRDTISKLQEQVERMKNEPPFSTIFPSSSTALDISRLLTTSTVFPSTGIGAAASATYRYPLDGLILGTGSPLERDSYVRKPKDDK